MAKIPNYPDIRAIDPRNCGCTECLIGEYVPLDTWLMYANNVDVANFLSGNVSNNTDNSAFHLVMNSFFSDPEVEILKQKLAEDVRSAMDEYSSQD